MADKLISQGVSPIPDPEQHMDMQLSVRIDMRDGIRLSTDLYFPKHQSDNLPVVLIRTPYNKSLYRPGVNAPVNWLRYHPLITDFIKHGYAVAIQDKRGKYESEGEYFTYTNDAKDGYDTIEWLGTRTWSNGNVGMYGCSYSGDVQIIVAQENPPHLKCIIPQGASGGGRYPYLAVRLGGATELAMSLGWWRAYGSTKKLQFPQDLNDEQFRLMTQFYDPSPNKLPLLEFTELKQLWASLPVVDMMNKSGGPDTGWEKLITTELNDPWWHDHFDFITQNCEISVPSLFENSWFDFGVAETLNEFNLFKQIATTTEVKENQYVIISPTCHCESEFAQENTIVGERNVGDARFNYFDLHIKWFDHWLKGKDTDVIQRPSVQYFLMSGNDGDGQWKYSDTWPLPNTQFTNLYLSSSGFANSRYGNGVLSFERSKVSSAFDEFVYDPASPVPSLGGPLCCTGSPDELEGAIDQRNIEMRHDVLVYTSEPLSEGIEVTGPLQLVLYVGSDCIDTDFTAKLIDVYPNGAAFNLQEGILRARYREGLDKKVWMEKDKIYKVIIDLQATSNFFQAGHKIRIEVSSSNFPRFDRNLNTGGNNYDEIDFKEATNRIYHNEKYPSHLVLPIIPN